MKRILALVLCAAILLSFPVAPLEARAATYGYYSFSVYYDEYESPYGVITDCDTSISGDIVIPSTLGGYPVNVIGVRAFEDCTSLKSVTIPDSVTTIGGIAFSGCASLESITIPDSVTSIGDSAFSGCASLESITIPDSVTSIGDNTFADCTGLKSVTIPDGVTSIGWGAFYGCDSLESVIIPDSVTSIGFQAFQECNSLTNITIPDSVTTIDDSTFWECHRLQIVTIPDSVTSIGSNAFWICSSLTDVYYAGSKAQWDAITIGEDNEDLINATIHYNHTHDYSLFDPVTVQYCDQTGYTEYTCIYGEKHRSPLPALGHLQETEGVVTPPTCTEDGYTAFVCARCSETVKTDMVSASGHNCTVFVETADPTCTEDGYTNMQCSNCEYVEKTNIVYALGHNMVVLPAVAPTCTDTGLTAGSACSRCEMVGVAQKEVPSLGGHSFEIGICTVCDTIALAITKLPSKLIYRAGEALDLSGLILLFNDKNGPTETVTEGYTISGFDSETTGDKFVTVTYGEFSVEFMVTVVNADAQIIDENRNAYPSLSAAVDAADAGSSLTLLADIAEDIAIGRDIVLDLNSFDITGTVTVAEGCTLYGMDSHTDDYTINDGYGYGKLTSVVGNVAGLPEESDLAEDGYLMITEEDGISFHRVNLQLTHMTLRAESAGVYFKSAFGGDEIVAQNVKYFGVALSLLEHPNQSNLGVTSQYSRFDGANFTAGENRSDATSTLLYGIMKTTSGRLTNTANAQRSVFGRAYVQLQDGSYLFGSVARRSLQEQVETIDTMWNSLTETQKAELLQMYRQFTSVMRGWNIPAIIDAAK